MRIRHFNTDLKGGAATAARRLHLALLSKDVESLFHYHPDYHDEPITANHRDSFQSISPGKRTGISSLFQKRRAKQWYSDYRKHLLNRPEEREIFTVPWQLDESRFGSTQPCDVVHLHWISSWLDLQSFFGSYPRKQPVVWTLHDMNAITGGCHHADECEKFKTACQSCPQIDSPGPRDISRRGFAYKKKIYRNRNLHIVTPSKWMEKNVRESSLGQFASSVRTIRNGLDLTLFQRIKKNCVRGEFSIPLDRPVIGFGAGSLGNRRKGFQDLVSSLQILSQDQTQPELTVLVFGVDDVELPSIPGIEFKTLGFLESPIQQQKAYSAMDFFVLPSWAENMPQTAVEAMACETAVVAYDVGGIPEIVIPNQTGALARHKDPQDLAHQIKLAISDLRVVENWGRNAREFVLKQFSMDESRDQYMELYRSLA